MKFSLRNSLFNIIKPLSDLIFPSIIFAYGSRILEDTDIR